MLCKMSNLLLRLSKSLVRGFRISKALCKLSKTPFCYVLQYSTKFYRDRVILESLVFLDEDLGGKGLRGLGA